MRQKERVPPLPCEGNIAGINLVEEYHTNPMS